MSAQHKAGNLWTIYISSTKETKRDFGNDRTLRPNLNTFNNYGSLTVPDDDMVAYLGRKDS